MKKIDLKLLIITSIVCVLPIILGIVFYDQLPDNMPIHFDINNNPDGYMPKSIFVHMFPFMMLLIHWFMCIIMDGQATDKDTNKKFNNITKWIIPILSVGIYATIIMNSIYDGISVVFIATLIVGVIFMVLGYYLPKTDGTVYINMPRVKDEKLNKKIKNIMGNMFVIDGVLFLFGQFISKNIIIIGVVILVIQAIGIYIYAWIKDK